MDYSQVIEQVKPSIARLVVTKKDVNGSDISMTGSGFIYKEKGKLGTCNHVIEGATKIQIKFADSTDFIDATIHKQDVVHDLAILNFSDDTRNPLKSPKSSTVKEGQPILFCGFPLTFGLFMTHQGMISGIETDSLGNTVYAIDGSNNKGNSGGPLLDKDGAIIGIMRLKMPSDADNFLGNISNLKPGAISIYGSDLVTIHQRLIENIQLGIGVAVPTMYMDAIVS